MGMFSNLLKFAVVSRLIFSTLFGILFLLLLKHGFGIAEYGIHLHTRTDGKLFNPSHLKVKTKLRHNLIKYMLFADDVAHIPSNFQFLMERFVNERKLGLTISLKK